MPPRSTASTTHSPTPAHLVGAMIVVALGILLASSCLQTWLISQSLSAHFLSPSTWEWLTNAKQLNGIPSETGEVAFSSIATPLVVIALLAWLLGAAWIARRSAKPFVVALTTWAWSGWVWWCAIGLWEWTWIAAGAIGWTSLSTLLSASPQFWLAMCLSGWLTTFICLSASSTIKNMTPQSHPASDLSPSEDGTAAGAMNWRWVWFSCALYVIVFTTMNWRLYFNLLIPHGDSAMYEEHLWNVLHGKGFRSYLDQGLFFGEHIQFVHLFLLPLYVLWPSHLLLELCESTALALGAFPVFWMTRRHAGSDRIALATAVAYLLYVPMQFLDIEIDLKTFRPEAFGIPLLLLTLDQVERRNLVGTLLGLAITLTVKEDYSIVFGPLGLWIAGQAFLDPRLPNSRRRCKIGAGLALSLFSVGYLWLATRVVMPWFRSGAEVHYARYFARFGESPEQIVHTMLTQPGLLFGELCSTSTLLYALMMLAPVAFLPLLAPDRLAVGLPLFGVLCLNELAKDPRHQFHAPLVAVVFWSLSAAIPKTIPIWNRLRFPNSIQPEAAVANIIWTSALMTGVFLSISPLGMAFWDPGSSWHWRKLYGPSQRGVLFARILPLIPRDSRVASTDFVHPRFTHYERSYDYSGYARKVAGDKTGVPDDTTFLVIDTNHRYSTIKSVDQVPEYRDHPDQWQIVPVETDGYFIVLKRRDSPPETSEPLR